MTPRVTVFSTSFPQETTSVPSAPGSPDWAAIGTWFSYQCGSLMPTSRASWAFVASAKPWKTTVAGCPSGSISAISTAPMVVILPCRYPPSNSASPITRPHEEVAFDLILFASISVVTSCVAVPALGSFLYSTCERPSCSLTLTMQLVSPINSFTTALPAAHTTSTVPSGLCGAAACSL